MTMTRPPVPERNGGTATSGGHQEVGPVQTRVVLRPIASSAPLAFFAFGVGTILYTSLQVGWVQTSDAHSLAILLVAFVAPLEILAGLGAALSRDSGLATATLLFGAVWSSLGISMLEAPAGSRSTIIGIFLLTASTMLLAISTVAVLGKPVLGVLLVIAVVRFVFSGLYEIGGATGIEHAAGWLGIPIVILSIYGGLAFLLEDTLHRTVLPVGRRREARDALNGGLDDQVANLHREAGVRSQL